MEFDKRRISSAEELLQRALRQLEQSEWTNLQAADPGVTIAEIFAWLTNLQQSYMDTVTPDAQEKMLDLLGIPRVTVQGAQTLCALSGGAAQLPCATKWQADGLIFENTQPFIVQESRLLEVCGTDGVRMPITRFDGHRGLDVFDQNPDPNETMMLFFDRPWTSQMTLHFTLEQDARRNPISSDTVFTPMAQLSWEWYAGNGEWKPLIVHRDDTYAMLFSGQVIVEATGQMQPDEQGTYPVRCRILWAQYDLPPRMRFVRINVLELTQQNTLCAMQEFAVQPDGRYHIPHDLAIYGATEVYQHTPEGWQACQAAITRDIAQGSVMLEIPSEKNIDAVLAVCYAPEMLQARSLGYGTGISGQILKLSIKQLIPEKLRLLVPDWAGNYTIWEQVPDFYHYDRYAQVFMYDSQASEIYFGDHIHGCAPPPSKYPIRVCQAVTSAGQASNLRERRITKAVPEHLQHLCAEQFIPAQGGRDTEKLAKRRERTAAYFDSLERAVTIQDYEALVRRTPGLIIQKVKILPAPLAVSIIVQGTGEVSQELSVCYKTNILNYLKDKRLACVELKVSPPIPILLTITGMIAVKPYDLHYQQHITQAVQDFIDHIGWGETLYSGELFRALDLLPCVSYIDKLRISAKGAKIIQEDIIPPPSGAYLLKQMEFTYLESDG